jgi:hypothetical protein
MKTLFNILAALFLCLALGTSCNVTIAQTLGLAHVCLMLWGVICMGLALFFQRSAHRAADEDAEDARGRAAGATEDKG